MDKRILLTGGLGYIGSHVAVELIEKGFEPIIVDDLSNSELLVLDRLEEITGKKPILEVGDVRDNGFLESVFMKYNPSTVIHFAAKKAVGESVEKPTLYYDVNVGGLISLLKSIEKHGITKLIFSSSCTVYGTPKVLPVTETTSFSHTPSPYGKTKQMCEMMLEDLSKVAEFDIVSLRYFNPVGAHPTGLIGELPKGPPNNLVPFITQTAAGIRKELSVFGNDYDTPDGSAIRDYIHVVDLAKAHVCSLEAEMKKKYSIFNLGTGQGYSVLEVVNSFEKVSGKNLAYKIVERREGDLPEIYGNPELANTRLNWKAEKGLTEMMEDAWRWQTNLGASSL